ncbi:AraC family transcriptional regulator ligand-binding domain-containing protein [Zooshikella marina]|uniref:AraC family transcriptional regulator n=1 Tax=Zooshikella ganghwensis TaxID=202772 RepID=UPI001BAF3F4F|nr:AraC family transcriptional regulator [Zooshikella ganghwensis]MBU2705244.1 AraC family transcriptional regulator ligand-binding domain-containing protein [Zooshikella ganghwensis]
MISKVKCRLPTMLSILLQQKGIDFNELLRLIHCSELISCSSTGFELTVDEYFLFWRTLKNISTNPLLGLELGAEIKPETFDPVFLAALASNTYQDALSRLARFKKLLYPAKIHIIENDSEVLISHCWTGVHDSEPDMLVDTEISFILRLGSLGLQQKVIPNRVELTRDAIAPGYAEKIGCYVKPNAKANILVLGKDVYQKSFITANPDLLEILDIPLKNKLALSHHHHSITLQVKKVLVNIITGEKPSLERVAAELSMSPRTLQRKLSLHNTNFNTLLTEVRKEMASYYLEQKGLKKGEIAFLLGFDSVNSFYRSYKKWR